MHLCTFIEKHGAFVTHGDNNMGIIVVSGNIGVKGTLLITDVLLVQGLKNNLLASINYVTKGFQVTFQPRICLISSANSRETHLVGKRVNNVHMLDIDSIDSNMNFLLSTSDETWC